MHGFFPVFHPSLHELVSTQDWFVSKDGCPNFVLVVTSQPEVR